MKHLLRILEFEFKNTAYNKAFVIITLVGPVFLILLSVLPPMLLQSNSLSQNKGKVAINSELDSVDDALLKKLEDNGIFLHEETDSARIEELILKGDLQGFLNLTQLDSYEVQLVTKNGSDFQLQWILTDIINEYMRQKVMKRYNISAEVGQDLKKQIQFKQEAVQAQTSMGANFQGFFLTAFTFTMMLYMTVLLYGQLIARSILREKQSKTSEVLLSSVSPYELLGGKLMGIGLAGVLQYGFWLFLAIIVLGLSGESDFIRVPNLINLVSLMNLFLYFLLAFLLYAGLYALLGTISKDEQHLSQLGLPVLFTLILPIVFSSHIIMNPDSILSILLSIFPLTGAIVMFIRTLLSPVHWIQLTLFGVIQIVSILSVTLYAGIAFNSGLILSSKRFSYKDLFKVPNN